MSDDPFPRDRLEAMLGRLPAYLRLAWRLARDPLISRARRAAVLAAAGYLVSPIDIIPGAIPGLGQLDHIAIAIAAVRLALDGLSPERRREHLVAVGLEDAHLVADLRTIGATVTWLGRSGVRIAVKAGRIGGRAAAAGGRAAMTGAGQAADGSRAAASRARDAATNATQTAATKAKAARAGLAARRRPKPKPDLLDVEPDVFAPGE